jgi:pimeloyl-ACP methyl ester carboxylesterase
MSLPPVKQVAGIDYRESGKPDAPALLLLHGIGSTSATWREQYGPLGEHFRVVAWTAPGYQRSRPLAAESPSANDYVAALAGLLDSLNISACHVVTNSWGTLVGLAFAALHSKRVGSLVLGGPSAGGHGMSAEERAKRARERIERARKLGIGPMREQDAPKLLSSRASKDALAWAGGASGEYPTEDGYCQAVRMLYATDCVELVRGLAQRVLVVSGTEDIITPPETNAKKLAAAARNGRLEWVEGSGHLPHLEHAAQFNSAVLGFVSQK